MATRSIGPVTGACTTGAAAGILVCGILDRFGWQITPAEAGAMSVLLSAFGGWLVKGPGDHRAIE